MATQSLYRRYRPRRFAEMKGQEHVVKALRESVAQGREGQAYLFSGPRGTGKTTSARILAKVLNCERPVDGEPCCECTSCLDVERGVSYDVHELDAASNNRVEDIERIISSVNLGTPGRHKVYILDEVHMLTAAASAKLLKTLEEPPSHVVFVLATTNPEKVLETIRSRTQHIRFHLLPPDVLAEHVRWVVSDAGLDVDAEGIAAAVSQGAGSARDTLSALELIANTGGVAADALNFDEFVESLIDHDSGRALTAMAQLVAAGHDPRTIAEELVKHLRNGFLALMASDLVQLPADAVDALAAQAQRLGAPALVAAVEKLGLILVEMRHAPDPRVLVEVALVQLTRPLEAAAPGSVAGHSGADIAALAERVTALEKALAAGAATAAAAPQVDPATGRARLGARAGRGSAPTTSPVVPAPAPAPPTADPATGTPTVEATETAAPTAAAPVGDPQGEWNDRVRPALRGLAKPLFAAVEYVGFHDGVVTFKAPNPTHQAKCAAESAAVQRIWKDVTGRDVTVAWGDGAAAPTPTSAPRRQAEPPPPGEPSAPVASTPEPAASASPTATAEPPTVRVVDSSLDHYDEYGGEDDGDAVHEVDESRPAISGAESALDRIMDAFPGAQRLDPPARG